VTSCRAPLASFFSGFNLRPVRLLTPSYSTTGYFHPASPHYDGHSCSSRESSFKGPSLFRAFLSERAFAFRSAWSLWGLQSKYGVRPSAECYSFLAFAHVPFLLVDLGSTRDRPCTLPPPFLPKRVERGPSQGLWDFNFSLDFFVPPLRFFSVAFLFTLSLDRCTFPLHL